MDQAVESTVRCYSGSLYAERPRSFLWDGQERTVVEIQMSLRTPDGKRFRVLADDHQLYLLTYNEGMDSWRIQAL